MKMLTRVDHFDAAPAPGDILMAPAPTLLTTKPTFLAQAKVKIMGWAIFSLDLFLIEICIKLNGKSKVFDNFEF
jgi:hypothetical protein